MSVLKFAMMFFDMLAIILRISDLMESATDDRLGFVLFGNDDPFKTMLSGTDPAILADEIGGTCPLHD